MNKKNILLAAILASLAAPAFAHGEYEGDAADKETREFHVTRFAGAPMPGFDFHHFGPMMRAGRQVKNAPYSAEAISENTQTLQDGNQISRKSSTMHYRDSAGRTRMEVRDHEGNVRNITINDGEATWILNPEKKTATKIGAPREIARLAAERAREGAEKAREHAEKAREAGEKAREHVIRLHREGNTGEDVRVRVMSNVQAHVGDIHARIAPIVVGAMGDSKYTRNSSSKDLGTREIDGVKAEGKQRSYEIPAGEIGNRNPIVVTSESWYSPELQMTVLSKHTDPRSGERTYRLANLKREEPAAALFTVPSDYTVKDVMAKIERRIEEKKLEKK